MKELHHIKSILKQLEREINSRHYKTDPVINLIYKGLRTQLEEIEKLFKGVDE
jgi:hypothetical protein